MKNRRFLAILLATTLFLAGCTAEDLDDDSDSAYDFEGSDSVAGVTNEDGDDLLDIVMVEGEDIAWSDLKIEMDNEDDDAVTCLPSSDEWDEDTECTYDEDDSEYWSVTESITIKEGPDNGVCSGPQNDIGGCEINIIITIINPDGDEIIIGEITERAQ